jgi:Flp pilus assembly protein TadD
MNGAKQTQSFTQHKELLVALLLAAAVLAVYWPVQNFNFIEFDDSAYITDNIHIKTESSHDALIWAFQDIHTGYWHPLTWISHVIDYRLYRLNAGGHHWTSVLFHMANTIILLMVFYRMTGALWKSAFVAGCFALHPMHVESVAWVAERKDVLSTFFLFLTIGCYLNYLNKRNLARYCLMLICYSLSLLSKPMVVTLPFVLLLLDYWPLKRFGIENFRWDTAWHLIREKIPLFLLSILVIGITLVAAAKKSNMLPFDILPVTSRIANALVAYGRYLQKAFFPADMSVFYPYAFDISWPVVVSIGLSLLIASGLMIMYIKRFPYLIVGWLWFLGVLLPAIGLVQSGAQAMADRYTYVSYIGLSVMIAWGVPDLLSGIRFRKRLMAVMAVATLSVLVILSWIQIQYWQNSGTLFQRAIEVTGRNFLAEATLGAYLIRQGKYEEAQIRLHKALEINPNYDRIYNYLGITLVHQRRFDEALEQYGKALAINSTNPDVHFNIGGAYYAMGKTGEAVREFRTTVALQRDHMEGRRNLALILSMQGKTDEAIGHYREMLKLKPNDADTLNDIGVALARKGAFGQAEKYFMEAFHINPKNPDISVNMGIALVAQGRWPEAVRHFEEALRQDPGNESALRYMKSALRYKR